MVAKSAQLARSWVVKTDIDYTTYFITAWITFNAWYGARYIHGSEREKIERIKNTASDPFYKAIHDFLEGTVPSSEEFLQHLGNLHYSLEQKILTNQQSEEV